MALANVTVIDDNATPGDSTDDFPPTFDGGDTDGDNELDTDETWLYSATRPALEGEHHNTAYANGESATSGTPAPEAEDEACYEGTTPEIAIKKYANGEDTDCVDVAVGADVVYTYDVTNPGTVALANVVVLDDNATLYGRKRRYVRPEAPAMNGASARTRPMKRPIRIVLPPWRSK